MGDETLVYDYNGAIIMAQEIKTMPPGILKKLRRMEMEIREILDFYDLNRTYFVSGKPNDVVSISKMLKKKGIPFEPINETNFKFEPEVYTQVTDLIQLGVEKGKIGAMHVHQTSEMVYGEETIEEEQNVFMAMYEFLLQFKAGKGYTEEASSYREELEEMIEENGLTKKPKKVRSLLSSWSECLVIKKDNYEAYAKHCAACDISWS